MKYISMYNSIQEFTVLKVKCCWFCISTVHSTSIWTSCL